MRRADRLFHILQILRHRRRPVTAAQIAEETKTSVRTIYRDIAQLIGERVPIRGEAGMGYVLDRGFDLPPLRLTADEIEAAMLGAQWVMGGGDAILARAAQDLLAKVTRAVPEHLRPLLLNPASMSGPHPPGIDSVDLAALRRAIRAQSKVEIAYCDQAGNPTRHILWPIAIAYLDAVRLVVAWCERRQAFHHFRTDRIEDMRVLEERYLAARTRLRADWYAQHMSRLMSGAHASD